MKTAQYIFAPPHFDEYKEAMQALAVEQNADFGFNTKNISKRACLSCGNHTGVSPNGFHHQCLKKWLRDLDVAQEETQP